MAQKDNKLDYSFRPDFVYRHRNPYHERLAQFGEFVLRDDEAEQFAGHWNSNVFQRNAPLHVEIGTGFGHFMLAFCAQHPEVNFVGLDYRFKRSFELAKKLERHPHKNFRYLRAKGERIHYIFGPQEVDTLYYFFPDPWPKKRHHKKRLLQAPFLAAVHQILKPTGKLLIKTDHDGYAQWMYEEIERSALFKLSLHTIDLHRFYPQHFLAQYTTKFEKIFLQQGVKIKAFVLEKN